MCAQEVSIAAMLVGLYRPMNQMSVQLAFSAPTAPSTPKSTLAPLERIAATNRWQVSVSVKYARLRCIVTAMAEGNRVVHAVVDTFANQAQDRSFPAKSRMSVTQKWEYCARK